MIPLRTIGWGLTGVVGMVIGYLLHPSYHCGITERGFGRDVKTSLQASAGVSESKPLTTAYDAEWPARMEEAVAEGLSDWPRLAGQLNEEYFTQQSLIKLVAVGESWGELTFAEALERVKLIENKDMTQLILGGFMDAACRHNPEKAVLELKDYWKGAFRFNLNAEEVSQWIRGKRVNGSHFFYHGSLEAHVYADLLKNDTKAADAWAESTPQDKRDVCLLQSLDRAKADPKSIRNLLARTEGVAGRDLAVALVEGAKPEDSEETSTWISTIQDSYVRNAAEHQLTLKKMGVKKPEEVYSLAQEAVSVKRQTDVLQQWAWNLAPERLAASLEGTSGFAANHIRVASVRYLLGRWKHEDSGECARWVAQSNDAVVKAEYEALGAE